MKISWDYHFKVKPGLGIRSLLIHSFPHFLILLKSNEQLWVICSDRSSQMSDSLSSLIINEQMGNLLKTIWLKKSKINFLRMFYIGFFCFKKWANEWIARFLQLIAHLLIFCIKQAIRLRKPMSEFLALL